MKILGICGSLRQASTNMGLLRYVREAAPEGGHIEIADLSDVPFYNADFVEKPVAVLRLFEQMAQTDALMLACPEYNYSLAPALKNVLDWASREPDNRLLAGKPVAILGSGGGLGTARAQYHLRQVCVFLDLHPLNKPEVLVSAFAGNFDEAGNLTSEKVQQQVMEQLLALQNWTDRLTR